MGVTIRDVAKKAGVSVSTVSKVMNHWKTISEETTKRVEAAAAELKYTPNARAVNFARGNTRNIIYLTELKKGEAYSNPHMFDIMCGVFTELARNGYTMSLMDISDEAHPKETIRDIIDQKSADGIVIHGSVINQATADLIIDRSFPHLVIGHPDFKELGLSVPEDVAFLTFDVYPYSTILDPKPEVVEINVYDMGIQAGAMICRKIDNPGLMIQSYITLPEME